MDEKYNIIPLEQETSKN